VGFVDQHPVAPSILLEEDAMPVRLHLDWELPDGALEEPFRTDLVEAIRREAALRLFANGKISSGYGAQMIGVSRWEFIDLLRERGIPLFSYGEGDLDRELAAFDGLAPDAKAHS
jgi:predicted HTH domain antitoxin